MRKLILMLALAAGACGSGEGGTGGNGGEDPLAKYRQRCDKCPISGGMRDATCCAPRGGDVACVKNYFAPVGSVTCDSQTEFEASCVDFDKDMFVSQGCLPRGFDCYAFMYSENPACCYEPISGWKEEQEKWVGPDGRNCSYANCDGSQACP